MRHCCPIANSNPRRPF